MGKKEKELCKWEKGTYGDKLSLLLPIVRDPRHACKSCGRVAREKKYLCKPVKLPDRA